MMGEIIFQRENHLQNSEHDSSIIEVIKHLKNGGEGEETKYLEP